MVASKHFEIRSVQLVIGDDARLPEGVSVEDLRRYLRDLESRLAGMAFPITSAGT